MDIQEATNSQKLEKLVRIILDKDCLQILSMTVSHPMNLKQIKKQAKIPFTSLYRKVPWLEDLHLIVTKETKDGKEITSFPINTVISIKKNSIYIKVN